MGHTRVRVKEIIPLRGKNIYATLVCVSIGENFFYLWDNYLPTRTGIMLGLSPMLTSKPLRGRHNGSHTPLRMENAHEALTLPDLCPRPVPRRSRREPAPGRPEAGYRNIRERDSSSALLPGKPLLVLARKGGPRAQ